MEGPPSPELMQYAEDLTRGWNTRIAAKSWRTEIDEVRASGKVHIVAEAACPDRYHVVTSGSESAETYYVGKLMYKRNGKAWNVQTLPMPYQGLAGCHGQQRAEDLDPSRVRLIAEQLKDIQLSKPVIRDIGGRKCREWTRTFESEKSSFVNTNCYDVNTHELVHSAIGNIVTTYYWNVPVDIMPPK